MSRIRSVHPGLWTDEAFVSLSSFARLLFMGLWNECDDKGLFVWSPIQLKMRVLPADNLDAGVLLEEMEGLGLILKYDFEGKSYGAVKNFAKFQRPKKPNNIFPATAEILEFAGHSSGPKDDETKAVRKQFGTNGEKSPQMEEGGGRREETPLVPLGRGKAKAALPKDWTLPAVADLPKMAKACAEQWSPTSYATHGEAFESFWRSDGRKKGDWRLTWANRVVDIHSKVMRDEKFGNGPGQPANDYAAYVSKKYGPSP